MKGPASVMLVGITAILGLCSQERALARITLKEIAAQSRADWNRLTTTPIRMIRIDDTYRDPGALMARFAKAGAPLSRPELIRAQSRTHERRDVVADPGRKLYRFKIEDRRDISGLLAENGLKSEDAINVNRPQALLVGFEKGNLVTAEYRKDLNQLTIIHDRYAQTHEAMPHLTPGLLGPEFYELAAKQRTEINEINVGDEKRVQITVHIEGGRTEAVLDPSRAYRICTLETYDARGQLVAREEYGDYRRLNGVWYPMTQKYELRDSEGNVKLATNTRILRAEPAATLRPDDFMVMIPRGTVVAEFTPDGKGLVSSKSATAESDILVSLELAELLARGYLDTDSSQFGRRAEASTTKPTTMPGLSTAPGRGSFLR